MSYYLKENPILIVSMNDWRKYVMTKTEVIMVTSFVICMIAAGVSGISLGIIKYSVNPDVVSFALISLMVTFISWMVSFYYALGELIRRIF